jgi:hypothetical protein
MKYILLLTFFTIFNCKSQNEKNHIQNQILRVMVSIPRDSYSEHFEPFNDSIKKLDRFMKKYSSLKLSINERENFILFKIQKLYLEKKYSQLISEFGKINLKSENCDLIKDFFLVSASEKTDNINKQFISNVNKYISNRELQNEKCFYETFLNKIIKNESNFSINAKCLKHLNITILNQFQNQSKDEIFQNYLLYSFILGDLDYDIQSRLGGLVVREIE